MGLGLHRVECLGGIGKISPESNALAQPSKQKV